MRPDSSAVNAKVYAATAFLWTLRISPLVLNFYTTVAYLLLLSGPAVGSSGLLGDWREPSGAVIRIAPCGPRVCATLMAIRPDSPERTDKMNPDPAFRAHPLCGLVIGKDFRFEGDSRADGGTLYDPKSGKTYHGEMTAEGDTLWLRGYVGFRMFGRTETWTRTKSTPVCSA